MKSQPREWTWLNQLGKKTIKLFSSTTFVNWFEKRKTGGNRKSKIYSYQSFRFGSESCDSGLWWRANR